MNARKCAAVDCDRGRRATHLMCPSCWAQVPKDIQRRVTTTWTPNTFRQTDEWTAAVAEAIASLRPAGTEELPL